MDFNSLTEEEWQRLIDSAPSESEQEAAYAVLKDKYRNDAIQKVKGFQWGFKSFGDQELENMFRAVTNYAFQFLMAPLDDNIKPYWLTILGKSEIGKSHLTHALSRFMLQYGERRVFPKFSYDQPQVLNGSSAFVKMSQVSNDTQIYNSNYLKHMSETTMLIMDDLHQGVKPWVKDDFCNILMLRAGEGVDPWKWTVITSNMMRDHVEKQFDARTASRMRRGKNIVIELSANIKAFQDR
ncbi:hypothetical protein OAI07_01240 [Akkermansiaceae bacterium]|nr:hypothetical protein [Akkermansiaceae bacterium]